MSWTKAQTVDGVGASGEDISNQYSSDVAAGSRLFAVVMSYGNPGGDNATYIFTNIEDDSGNTWVAGGTLVRSAANSGHIGVIYTCVHNGSVDRPTVLVEHNRSAGHPYLALALEEWFHSDGIDGGVFDYNARGDQTSPGTSANAVTTGEVDVDLNDSLILAFCTAEDLTTISAGTNYTLTGSDHLDVTNSFGRGESRIVNAGAYTPTFTLGTNRAVLSMAIVISPPEVGSEPLEESLSDMIVVGDILSGDIVETGPDFEDSLSDKVVLGDSFARTAIVIDSGPDKIVLSDILDEEIVLQFESLVDKILLGDLPEDALQPLREHLSEKMFLADLAIADGGLTPQTRGRLIELLNHIGLTDIC